MADIVDKAQALQQQQIDAALQRHKQPQQTTVLIKGKCNYCHEPVTDYFCDDECREDYEREQRLIAHRGVVL